MPDRDWTVLDHGPLTPITENLWVVHGAIPMMAIRRWMVVVRLENGDLVIWNAIAMDENSMSTLESLGRPAFLVVPNGWHRLDAPRYKARYPDLKVLCPSGARRMVERRVTVDGTLESSPTPGGADSTVRFAMVQGEGAMEGAMLARSQDGDTLVFGDLFFNCTQGPGFWWWFYGKALGSAGGPKATPMTKALLTLTRRKELYRRWLLEQSERGDTARILPGHGEMITEGACDVLRAVAEKI